MIIYFFLSVWTWHFSPLIKTRDTAAKLLQCSALWDPMDCSLSGSSVHGILQARILDWLPFTPPGDLPDPGTDFYHLYVSCIGRQILYYCHLGNPEHGISLCKSLSKKVTSSQKHALFFSFKDLDWAPECSKWEEVQIYVSVGLEHPRANALEMYISSLNSLLENDLWFHLENIICKSWSQRVS